MKQLSYITVVIHYCLVKFYEQLRLFTNMPVPDFNNKYDETML